MSTWEFKGSSFVSTVRAVVLLLGDQRHLGVRRCISCLHPLQPSWISCSCSPLPMPCAVLPAGSIHSCRPQTSSQLTSTAQMGQASSIHLGRQLIKAIEAGDVDAVMKLVTQHPQLLHYSTFARFGPCHYAAKGSHTEVLQLLLAKADELDQQATLQAGSSSTSSTSTGALHQGHHNKAGSLTTRLVNAPSDRGVTCLMLAAKNGSLDCVRLLLDKVRV